MHRASHYYHPNNTRFTVQGANNHVIFFGLYIIILDGLMYVEEVLCTF